MFWKAQNHFGFSQRERVPPFTNTTELWSDYEIGTSTKHNTAYLYPACLWKTWQSNVPRNSHFSSCECCSNLQRLQELTWMQLLAWGTKVYLFFFFFFGQNCVCVKFAAFRQIGMATLDATTWAKWRQAFYLFISFLLCCFFHYLLHQKVVPQWAPEGWKSSSLWNYSGFVCIRKPNRSLLWHCDNCSVNFYLWENFPFSQLIFLWEVLFNNYFATVPTSAFCTYICTNLHLTVPRTLNVHWINTWFKTNMLLIDNMTSPRLSMFRRRCRAKSCFLIYHYPLHCYLERGRNYRRGAVRESAAVAAAAMLAAIRRLSVILLSRISGICTCASCLVRQG